MINNFYIACACLCFTWMAMTHSSRASEHQPIINVKIIKFTTSEMDCDSGGCIKGCMGTITISNHSGQTIDGFTLSFPIDQPRSEIENSKFHVSNSNIRDGGETTFTGQTINQTCENIDFTSKEIDCKYPDEADCSSIVKITNAGTTNQDIPSIFPGNLPNISSVKVIKSLNLWATHYKVHTAEHVENGIELQDTQHEPLGPKLAQRDFCEAAMQGTVSVSVDGKRTTYNSHSSRGNSQTDCLGYYTRAINNGNIKKSTIRALEKTKFFKTNSAYGLGVRNWDLVPYRSIAVDRSQKPIPYQSVVYIPDAVGQIVTLPDGTKVQHDGYFFAVDTGGNIKKDHIDIFGGILQSNPFSSFIGSRSDQKFKAIIIKSDNISNFMKKLHNVK